MLSQCDMKKCWYVRSIKQYENFYMALQGIRKEAGGLDIFVEETEKLMDEFEYIAEEHAPDEIRGTDEGSEGSGSGPSEAVNEPES